MLTLKKYLILKFALVFFIFCDLQGAGISIIIPCVYKHACYLQNLLEHYKNQTLLPDEIIISLSESDKIDPLIIYEIEETS